MERKRFDTVRHLWKADSGQEKPRFYITDSFWLAQDAPVEAYGVVCRNMRVIVVNRPQTDKNKQERRRI